MERGMDPELKRYFRKIIHSFSYGMAWLVANTTAGIYFGLAYSSQPGLVLLFYAFFGLSLFLLIRYYYRTWKK